MTLRQLPSQEVRFLNDALSAAQNLVDEGRYASGYDLLRAGLGRARVREAHGAEGGEALVHLWSSACDIYWASYGVDGEPRSSDGLYRSLIES